MITAMQIRITASDRRSAPKSFFELMHEFENTVKQGLVVDGLAECKKFWQYALIHCGWNQLAGEYRLYLGSKQERAVTLRIIQGLNTQPVSRREQTLVSAVPKSKGKHPSQFL